MTDNNHPTTSVKQTEILRYIERYVATGIIPDGLIPYYDQHGKWRGNTIRWPPSVPDYLLERMRKSHLPASFRTSKSRSGTILRTSFYWRGEKPAVLTYCGIEGSFIVTGNAPIYAACLRRIGGNLISQTKLDVHLTSLVTVGGHLELMHSFTVNVPRLRHVEGHLMMVSGRVPPRLESVGGRYAAYWAFEFHARALRQVGGTLILHKSDEIRAPVLERVGGGFLLAPTARNVDVPVLRSIGGDFLAGSAASIRAPLLRAVAGNLDSTNATAFYDPAIRVGGQWTTHPGAVEEWKRKKEARLTIRGAGPRIHL